MSTPHSYPTLRLAVLQSLISLKHQLEVDPKFLDGEECPYDAEVKDLIHRVLTTTIVEKVVEKYVEKKGQVRRGPKSAADVQLSAEDQEEVEATATDLLKELKGLGKMDDGEDRGLDTQTRITIIKAKAALVEQLLKVRERLTNVRRIAHFQTTVISILDDLVGEDDRSEFLKRLEPYRD